MIDLASIISTIESLLAENTPASATYAALECRLAIEKISYDRLRLAHDYISHDDLKRWRPQDVIHTLMQEVDDQIGEKVTLSISSLPLSENDNDPEGSFEDKTWVEVGTQYGLNHKRLGELWQALSQTALHVELPKSTRQPIGDYGDHRKIVRRVEDALSELHRISKSTIAISGVGEEVSFDCVCGRRLKRRMRLLTQNKVVGCVDPGCAESYRTVAHDDGSFTFERRMLEWDCSCGRKRQVLTRALERIPHGKRGTSKCECGAARIFEWGLRHQDVPAPAISAE